MQFWLLVFIFVITWYITKKRKWIYIIYKTWKRDIKLIIIGLKTFFCIIPFERKQQTVIKLFKKTVEKNPDKIAFHFEDEAWTFKQVDNFSNKVGNYFLSIGFKKGETVALLLENRPEFVAIWLGLGKIGIVTALINTNLRTKSLENCISIVGAEALIFGSDFVKAVTDIHPNLEGIRLFQFDTIDSPNQVQNAIDLKNVLTDFSNDLDDRFLQGQSVKDILLYVYTSGTTGLPKAAKITHSRFIFMACSIYNVMELTENDIFYNPLPLYHSSGGVMSLGLCLIFGLTMVVRKKFSASNFWKDCIKYNCTASNYIGETCRYILEAHKGQKILDHKVKKMYGNGLKKDIWEKFLKAFNNPRMYEGYGSTEGNVNMINLEGKIGAVGFIPIILNPISPIILIKYDEETYEPIRDRNGFCIKCKDNEPGLLIGRINKQLSTCRFEGYANQKETNKKILTNVFKNGDKYFNSGDLFTKDECNYLYFKDRVGDTYRWKGENVATTEVECIVSEILGPKDIVVYGVEIPDHEGKAGMIGIVDNDNSVNSKVLAEGLKSHLPGYAIPLFLRKLSAMPLTTTFKIQKNQLQKEGFDINVVQDAIYMYDSKAVDYVPIEEVYDDLINGKMKL
ncbi:long-chain fatty acid transport protein 1-like isoform X1 [Diorhabda carinulata]|uniref:long-chain fatty acid transport protein 1-like isoform X1 n=1 Tax=Diorhabda carinulata TaxID=1163345 RepID=UPI0025A24C28|nr:long-chain fatty acid transport protein 1-like isoform X1 [Diorhabda carinulata]